MNTVAELNTLDVVPLHTPLKHTHKQIRSNDESNRKPRSQMTMVYLRLRRAEVLLHLLQLMLTNNEHLQASACMEGHCY